MSGHFLMRPFCVGRGTVKCQSIALFALQAGATHALGIAPKYPPFVGQSAANIDSVELEFRPQWRQVGRIAYGTWNLRRAHERGGASFLAAFDAQQSFSF